MNPGIALGDSIFDGELLIDVDPRTKKVCTVVSWVTPAYMA